MASNGSHGASWADQWDNGPDPDYSGDQNKKGAAATTNYKQKVGEGLGKTKSVASNGVKKVKESTTVGFQWIKSKCQKTPQKN